MDDPAASLPGGAVPYRRTAVFDEMTIPPALRLSHSTKAATWALIHVLEGRLAYRIDDPRRTRSEQVLTPDTHGLIEPTILHAVEPRGRVRFYVEFYRHGAPR